MSFLLCFLPSCACVQCAVKHKSVPRSRFWMLVSSFWVLFPIRKTHMLSVERLVASCCQRPHNASIKILRRTTSHDLVFYDVLGLPRPPSTALDPTRPNSAVPRLSSTTLARNRPSPTPATVWVGHRIPPRTPQRMPSVSHTSSPLRRSSLIRITPTRRTNACPLVIWNC